VSVKKFVEEIPSYPVPFHQGIAVFRLKDFSAVLVDREVDMFKCLECRIVGSVNVVRYDYIVCGSKCTMVSLPFIICSVILSKLRVMPRHFWKPTPAVLTIRE